MAWNITGQLLDSCSCNMLCPCWFGVKELMVMDQGWCAAAWVYHVRQGNSDGVNLDGCTLATAFDWPGPTILDGNGTGRIYIDQAATAAQRRELEGIFQARKGGPLEVLGSLISLWLPTQTADINIQEEADTLTVTVGDFGQYKSQPLKNEEGQPMTMQNVGFATALQFDNQTAQLAPSGSRWSDPDMPHQFETKSGAVANFTWTVS